MKILKLDTIIEMKNSLEAINSSVKPSEERISKFGDNKLDYWPEDLKEKRMETGKRSLSSL